MRKSIKFTIYGPSPFPLSNIPPPSQPPLGECTVIQTTFIPAEAVLNISGSVSLGDAVRRRPVRLKFTVIWSLNEWMKEWMSVKTINYLFFTERNFHLFEKRCALWWLAREKPPPLCRCYLVTWTAILFDWCSSVWWPQPGSTLFCIHSIDHLVDGALCVVIYAYRSMYMTCLEFEK